MRKKIIKLIGVLVILGAIVFFAKVQLIRFMYTSPYFDLREINISGEGYVTREKILVLSHFSPGDNIFKVDIAEGSRKIEAHPLVKQACITRKLPDVIDIKVKERNQVAYISFAFKKKYGLDDEGVILPLLDEKLKFPTVTGLRFAKVVVGERLKMAGVKSAINVVEAIKDSKMDDYIEVAEINVVKPAHPVLYTKARVEIRLGNFPLRNQFDSLKLILVDLREKGSCAEYIDLRFGEKIVVKEKKRL